MSNLITNNMNREFQQYLRHMLPKDAQSIQSRLAQEVMFKKRRFNNKKLCKPSNGRSSKRFFQLEKTFKIHTDDKGKRYLPKDYTIKASETTRAINVSFKVSTGGTRMTKTVIITDKFPFFGANKVDNQLYQRTLVYDVEPKVLQIKHSSY